MKPGKWILLIISAFSFLQATAQVNTKSLKKEEQVWQNAEAVNKAVFETKDSTRLKALLHHQVTYGHSGGALEDKKVMIQKAVTSPTMYKNITLEKITVRVTKKTAIVRHNLRATATENNIQSLLDLSILQVWVKQKGAWQLLARQAVKIPAIQK